MLWLVVYLLVLGVGVGVFHGLAKLPEPLSGLAILVCSIALLGYVFAH